MIKNEHYEIKIFQDEPNPETTQIDWNTSNREANYDKKCKEETLPLKAQLPQIEVLPIITEKKVNYYTKKVTTKIV